MDVYFKHDDDRPKGYHDGMDVTIYLIHNGNVTLFGYVLQTSANSRVSGRTNISLERRTFKIGKCGFIRNRTDIGNNITDYTCFILDTEIYVKRNTKIATASWY